MIFKNAAFKGDAATQEAQAKKANHAFNLGLATQLATIPGITPESLGKRIKVASRVITDTVSRRERLYTELLKTAAKVTAPAPAAAAPAK